MMRRPTKVKVLTRVYTIRWISEDEWYAGRMPEDSVGYTEKEKSLISVRLDPSTDEESLRETLLHELLHTTTQAASWNEYLKEVGDPEEFAVRMISPILLAVLKDNPSIVAYLLTEA